MENRISSQVQKDLQAAIAAGEGKRSETLQMILKELKTNETSHHPEPESAVISRLFDEITRILHTFDDYVTADHGMAKMGYKKDLDVIREYLEN